MATARNAVHHVQLTIGATVRRTMSNLLLVLLYDEPCPTYYWYYCTTNHVQLTIGTTVRRTKLVTKLHAITSASKTKQNARQPTTIFSRELLVLFVQHKTFYGDKR
jgi:hypothetical protein